MLIQRVLSAVVMAPLSLAAVWYGAWPFDLVVAAAAGIMAWEWGQLTGGGGAAERSIHQAILGVATVIGAAWIGFASGLVLFIVGFLLIERLRPSTERSKELWSAGGLVWITLPCVALIWIREDPIAGAQTVTWIMATVWAIDTAAFVVGKTIGGPRLAPRISPSKTWSGLAGGIIAAGLVGLVASFLMGGHRWVDVALIGAGLALVEQAGDLAESYAKRRFGAKDSGTLIPGHGGLLDRLDGMLAVVVAVVLLERCLGESVLLWH